MKKFLLGIFLCGLCVLLVGAAFAAMSDEEFIELCKTGTLQQVEEAIKGGANVHAEIKGMTPVMAAVMFNPNREIVDMFIKAGIVKNSFNFTPLMLAIAFGTNLETIAALISVGEDVNAGDESGNTPLGFAVQRRIDPEVVINMLIKAGVDVNAAKNREGTTALMKAGSISNPEAIVAVVKGGADVNAQNKKGDTPLTLAAEKNPNPGIITALIECGANVNATNAHGWTPLVCAAMHSKNPEIITALVKGGANVNAQSEKYGTPLTRAVMYNANPEITIALINAGANVNAKMQDGSRPIDIARRNKKLLNTEAYRLLEAASK